METDFAGASLTHQSHSSAFTQRQETFGHGSQESAVRNAGQFANAEVSEPMAWELASQGQRPEGRSARREPSQQVKAWNMGIYVSKHL